MTTISSTKEDTGRKTRPLKRGVTTGATMTRLATLAISGILILTLSGCSQESLPTSPSEKQPGNETSAKEQHAQKEDEAATHDSTLSSGKDAETGIEAYDDLLKAPYGTKVSIEGEALNNAFDRAWKGTHYQFNMTFGDTNNIVCIDMDTKLKSSEIKRGTRVSVTGICAGTTYASGAGYTTGPDHQAPKIIIDSYRVIL